MSLKRENHQLRQRVRELEQQLHKMQSALSQCETAVQQIQSAEVKRSLNFSTQTTQEICNPWHQIGNPFQIDCPQSETLFRAYVETVNDMVYVLDLTGALTFVNSYGQRLLGCSEEEWFSRSYLDFVAISDRERTAQAFANLLQTGELTDFEFVLQPKHGTAVCMSVNGRLLYQGNQLIGGIGIARNVSERKRFEQQLQMFLKALESAYDSAVITDLKGKILYANPAAIRMFGSSLTSFAFVNLEAFYPEEGQAQVKWLIQQAIAGGWSGEVICQRCNGERFPALVSTGLIVNEHNQPEAISIISRDITEQKQTQAELAAKNIELERASRMKSEFLANMSHELRTPLTSILGFSYLLQQQLQDVLNAKQAVYIQQIHQSGEHLLNLINDVLDLSKVEAGQITLNIAPIAIAQLCEDTLALVSEQARLRAIAIHQSVQAGLSSFTADELRVRQMLLNLLSNAIKFSHDNSEIGLDISAQAGYLYFTVWDTGIGIPENKHNLLFQPFQQLDSSLTRRHEGTGLGLALTRQLAELHGGTVEFESKEGEGSRFTIRLPQYCYPRLASDSPDFVEPAELYSLITSPPVSRILIVEDHPLNAMLLQDILQHWGYEVHHAVDGGQAIAWLQSHVVDVILLDIHLPDVDGFEVSRRLREQPKWQQIPIIATTALAMVGDRDRCLAAGMQDYISKPLNYEELAELLSKYTGHVIHSHAEQYRER